MNTRPGDGLAEEQAALRRVATLVARGAAPEEIFGAVAAEVGRVLEVDYTVVNRFHSDGAFTIDGAWAKVGDYPLPVGTRIELGGHNISTCIFQTHRPARVDDYTHASGPAAEVGRAWGFGSAVGVPIDVAGRLWGAVIVSATRPHAHPPDTEARLAGFTELVGTALANAESQAELLASLAELRRFSEEQAALRRVATLVARGAAPEEIFGAVAAEIGRMLEVDLAAVNRFDPDGVTVAGAWAKTGDFPIPVGTRTELGGHNLHTCIFQTHRPARVDDYTHASGPAAEAARASGLRSGVGVPIDVAGRLWGAMIVTATRPHAHPPDTEARLAGFTELVGTALANAESQAELLASRARIVAAADAARKRIERNLHDGAQQHLVSVGLKLRAFQAALPSGRLAREFDDIMTEVRGVLDELRAIGSGLHPAALTDGGLRPALKTLARRSAVPVRLNIGIEGRLPEQVELAAYYSVAETLTNAAKHAHATVVDVTVRAHDGFLRIAVRDDGEGGATFSRGSGLAGLTDRVEALGGRLSLDSPPGAGTLVTIALPCAAENGATEGRRSPAGASPDRG